MTNGHLVSSRFPYLFAGIEVDGQRIAVEALLDTEFEGQVAVPPGFIANSTAPSGYTRWTLADGSPVIAPYFVGTVDLAGYGPFSAVVIVLGDQPLIGAGAIRHVSVILDHGRRVIVQL